ncbi:MAG: two-component sensor histidine kinase [Bacteroides sp.]|nr:two-component sensor histidine kinase [Bacteroides sp.]
MTLQLPKHLLSFSRQLFLSVIALFVAFVICFMAFQYRREKDYKVELLNTQLQNYNDRMSDFLRLQDSLDVSMLNVYVKTHHLDDLRVTVIDPQGEVVFDNLRENPLQFNNHLGREEVQQALTQGSGYAINRLSESVGGEFFYSARYYNDLGLVIRSALPYTVNLTRYLKADSHYVWFAIIISLVLIGIFYSFTHKLGMSIKQLQQFAMKADRNEPIDADIQRAFPRNELGEISQHIIQIYHRLHKTKENLYIEREKLITHLRMSHEGLGVFTKKKKEILVNNLFTQYINFISDKNLSNTEEIFSVPELQPISDFLLKNNEVAMTNEEKRMAFEVNKNGRIFAIACIIFQDDSFEISINDMTQEEEQARMKRQLTQNIAHELKTPVSSIQGYLETIVNNPDLPRERINTFLERSYAQSNRLTHLLRDISTLTRMEEAPDMAEKENIELSLMMQNILEEVALQLEEKHITAHNIIPDSLVIHGNPSMIYSIFRNLTDNAIAYAGTGIEITIRCFRQDEHFYYFSFADTGIGIGAEHLGRIFERFYRVDKGRSRKLGGTGLGLAIVKNAVLLHGGTIFAKNNPGGGLAFIFTLAK